MILVYYEGNGLWFDFPGVDSSSRSNARSKWIAENIPATSGDNRNDDEWEAYTASFKEWEKNNPPPKYKVIEDEIYLERERYFDFSEPVLHFQSEEAFVSAVFKLKSKDERRLRYKKEVTVETLLPSDHPDGDKSGFFFRLEEPYKFTQKDIVFDEPYNSSRSHAMGDTEPFKPEQAETLENDGAGDYQTSDDGGKTTEELWLIPDPEDPKPEQPWYTPARYFARQHIQEDSTLRNKRDLLAKKVSESFIQVGIKKRGDVNYHDPATILKAFTNVKL